MIDFVEHTLYETSLPKEYLDLLRQLEGFDRLVDTAKKAHGPDRAECLNDLNALHDACEARSRQKLAPDQGVLSNSEAEVAFARATLLVSYYADTVYAELPVVDTCGSRTLSFFKPDATPDSRETLRTAVNRAFDLDESVHTELERELDALRFRQSIIAAIETLHPLTGDAQTLDQTTYSIFSLLYPDHPLQPGDIKIIRTGTGLFFGIPYEGESLLTDDFEQRTNKQAIAAFLTKIASFRQRFYAHFPSFGFFQGDDADADFLDRIADRVQAPRERVAATLTTMVTLIPLQEIDKYIVHDVWGHYWQALLFRFEDTYKDVSNFLKRPELDEDALQAIDRVVNSARAPAPDLAAWDDYLQNLMMDRLTQTMSGLLAEVLADAVEYKVLAEHPELATLMPSSSFFKHLPAKLDLTLRDLPFYFRLALGWFRKLDRPKRRQHFVAAYLKKRPQTDPDTATLAIELLSERTLSWIDEVYHDGFRYTPAAHEVFINVFAKVVLNYAALHIAINDTHQRLRERTFPPSSPLRGGLDLLVFAVAAFYEADRTRNFWHLDEFSALHFERCFERLLNELA